MAEVLVASYLTAVAVDKFAGYFFDEAGGILCSWCKTLRELTWSVEYRAVTGDVGG